MIIKNYRQFIDEIYRRVKESGIDTSILEIDHIAYQAESSSDYDNILLSIKEIGTVIIEAPVEDRRVGIVKLNTPLEYNGQSFSVIEVIEPKANQEVKSAWEHIEFLTKSSPEDLISQYPQINWDTSKLNQDRFPMLILDLGDGLRAKFP